MGADGHHCGDIDMATGMFSGGAAFGVFPQMQPRRRLQDPEGSANVPLDVTRGRLAGLLGLPADILNLKRSLLPQEAVDALDQYRMIGPEVPYGTEQFLKDLPLAPTSRVGEVAGQAGAFVPLNPMPAARAVAAGARALGPTAVGMGEGYLQRQGLMPQLDVYHGSPHKFDKFDASKIGTGEGAQAYGHGLYLAESPDVAKGYKDKLSPDTITRVKNDVYNIAGDDNHILTIYDANGKATKTPYLSPDELDKWVGKDAADMLRAKGDGDYKGLNIDFGNLYKLDLPDEKIAKMLDWDKPLSEQPWVMSRVKPMLEDSNISLERIPLLTGKDLMSVDGPMAAWFGKNRTPSMFSEGLRQEGIPGIKYLDGNSRGGGKGTRNFVTFPGEEQSMTILERNGQPLKARGGLTLMR